MKQIEVVAGIIQCGSKTLCVQRPASKLQYISEKFEFPGGKIEAGETKVEALKRELMEELEINPEIEDLFLTVNHSYPDFELIMHSFICKSKTKKLKLVEHISAVWLEKDELNTLNWAAADLPIVDKLKTHV